MASTTTREIDSAGQMRRIDLTLSTGQSFPIPKSDGYPVYSALLSVIDDVDTETSQRIHNSNLGSLHSSGLIGCFGGSDRPHHKTVRSDTTYDLSLGVIDPADEEIFQSLVSALVLEGNTIELSHGEMRVESFESSNMSRRELIEEAGAYEDPVIEMEFQSPTCIKESDGITTMFPHRGAVFNSLLGKWNRSVPEKLELDLTREEIEANVIEKPDDRSYCTHSVLVNRVKNGDGENRNLFRQGFTGECAYAFKDASESVKNAVTALALFGKYSGVGSAVARGCGNMNTEIKE